ncbi:Uma2 family endonuclease [Nodosilinea sp. LEGE 06152]|uniref:Uma2 family endonuclease n=1 Tax=Nodosilinea sp. LEGE 06152 TaxID=2777966 RepID=UPI001881B2AA|nr:Uma2 family endonuclease [Nodosilinea sp. LEGE 06152]MBE9158554.1 Uma2 family endonuclease [Nodosilinea sp. LEGE 06152]
MIAQPQVSRTYSPEEYLDLEVASEIRYEYIAGDIVPMTGGTPNHNRIIRNLCTALTIGLQGRDLEVFVADQRLWIPQAQIYTYPDVMAIAGELTYQTGRRDTLTNPTLIIEVLSASTRNYDRGDKFAAYRTIATFQEYALVDQYSAHVEHYVKTGSKQWMLQEYDGLDTVLNLVSLGLEISLRDIYNKVQFEPAAQGEEAQI